MSRKEIEMALQAQYRSPAVQRSVQSGEDRAHRPSSIVWVAVGTAIVAATTGILVGRTLSTTSATTGATTVAAQPVAPQSVPNANAREGRTAASLDSDANLRAHLLSLPPATRSFAGTNANAREGRTAAVATTLSVAAINPNLRRDVTANVREGRTAAVATTPSGGAINPNLRADLTATKSGIGPGPLSHPRLGPVVRHFGHQPGFPAGHEVK